MIPHPSLLSKQAVYVLEDQWAVSRVKNEARVLQRI